MGGEKDLSSSNRGCGPVRFWVGIDNTGHSGQ
jgi:hypothetical protein